MSLLNFRLSAEERAARDKEGDYGLHDGEAKIEISGGDKIDLGSARSEDCVAGDRTLAIHECVMIRVGARDALWVLSDHSNDGDCTCRSLYINGPKAGLVLGGGGCIGCSQTPRLLREVEQILLSLEFR